MTPYVALATVHKLTRRLIVLGSRANTLISHNGSEDLLDLRNRTF